MFGGFKASLNLFGKRNSKHPHAELTPDMTVSGAYRTSRDDTFGYNNSFEQSKKPSTTASDQVLLKIRPTKGANDLSKLNNLPPHLRHSANEVSRDPRGAQQDDPRNGVQNIKLTKSQEKEQKKLDKQRLAEHKDREKQAREEQAKQERLRERERKNVQQIKEQRERRPEKKKKSAPQPQVVTLVTAQTSQQYSTNTLESSISRSSGPPPYSDVPTMLPEPSTITENKNKTNKTGNVLFKKPEDTGSWDLISQHRQQTIRPTSAIGGGGSKNKPKVMDLNYNVGASSQAQDNSEA